MFLNELLEKVCVIAGKGDKVFSPFDIVPVSICQWLSVPDIVPVVDVVASGWPPKILHAFVVEDQVVCTSSQPRATILPTSGRVQGITIFHESAPQLAYQVFLFCIPSILVFCAPQTISRLRIVHVPLVKLLQLLPHLIYLGLVLQKNSIVSRHKGSDDS